MKFIPGFNNRYSVDKEGKIYSFNNFHKHQGNGSGDDRYITTMTQINMRYNPDCLNRDIAKYNRREWEEK
jgi:hypothetical protein